MIPSYDEFKTIMEENTDGHEVEVRFGEPKHAYPAVRIMAYRGLPFPGHMTCVTYGLSHRADPSWGEERPELVLRIRSLEDRWIGVVGFVATLGQGGQFAGTSGQMMTFNFPMSPEESEMNALVVGGPAEFPINPIQLPDRKVMLLEVHPIYSGEMDLVTDGGWEAFVESVGRKSLPNLRRQDKARGRPSRFLHESR